MSSSSSSGSSEEEEDAEDSEQSFLAFSVDGQVFRPCQICLTENAVLINQPCNHQVLCEGCYRDQLSENTEVFCPLCLRQINKALPCKADAKKYIREASLPRAKAARAKALAATRLRQELLGDRLAPTEEDGEGEEAPPAPGIFQVTEPLIGACFGPGVQAFFYQTRMMLLGFFLLCCCSAPYYLSLLQALPRSDMVASADLKRLIVLDFTVAACFSVKECDIPWWTPAVDTGGVILLFLISRRVRHVARKLVRQALPIHEEAKIACRCVALVQASHLDAMPQNACFAPGKPATKGEKKVEPAAMNEESQPQVKMQVVGCGMRNVAYACALDERLRLYNALGAMEQLVKARQSKTKQFARATKAVEVLRKQIRALDESIFKHMLEEEELGAVTRLSPPVQLLFVLFRRPLDAATLRAKMAQSHWTSLKLIFGAPERRFALLGSPRGGDIFPSNIDWHALLHPHRFAQSGLPSIFGAAVSIFAVAFVLTLWQLLERLIAIQVDHALIGIAVGVAVAQIFAAKFFKAILRRTYRSPLKSRQEEHNFFLVAFAVHAASLLSLAAGAGLPTSPQWWTDSMCELSLILAVCTLAYAVFYGWLFRSILVPGVRSCLTVSTIGYSQAALNRRLAPPKWSIADAHVDLIRATLVATAFSGVVHVLAVVGFLSLSVVYAYRKALLVRVCQIPVKYMSFACVAATADMIEVALMLRLLSTAAVLWVLQPSRFDWYIPLGACALVGYYFVHYKLGLCRFYAKILLKLTWICHTGCFPKLAQRRESRRKKKREFRRQRENKKVEALVHGKTSSVKLDELDQEIRQQFDLTQFRRYKLFFDNVQSLQALDKWTIRQVYKGRG